MQITTKDADVRVDGSLMRLYVAAPREPGKYPGIVLWSEIFQLTGPIRRSVERLAGHGFVVAAPEIYHRIERPGVVIPYDDIGRMWGLEDAGETATAEFDADAAATLNYLASHPQVKGGKFGTMGFCIGGHLAFRAALQPQVAAAVCCYPTGVHNGKLGKDDPGTLARLAEIRGDMLVVYGRDDPHVPEGGRKIVADALRAARVKHTIRECPGEHAFMRDEGTRYDSASADAVWAEAVALFSRTLA
jgi:carboxymethylenebutenolidase